MLDPCDTQKNGREPKMGEAIGLFVMLCNRFVKEIMRNKDVSEDLFLYIFCSLEMKREENHRLLCHFII